MSARAASTVQQVTVPRRSTRGVVARVGRTWRRTPVAILGLILVVGWLTLALLGPLVVPGDPNEQDLTAASLPPAWEETGTREHLLGTDNLGRDIFLRIIHGSRTSLLISLLTVGLSAVVGSLAGVVAASGGGLIDDVVMRVVDVQLAIPYILIAITVLALLGGSFTNTILVLALSGWVVFARIVRGELLHLRELEYVTAAQALGAGSVRIGLRHLLPNVTGIIIIIATLELSNVIILEASLSFLGVGIRPPDISWGTMLASGRDYLSTAWWISTIPGIFITLIVLGVNMLGDWVRDLLDPRFQNERVSH